ncbi:MFS transporter [Escherichia coli]|nr:MFS transporter [Escherichia coli]
MNLSLRRSTSALLASSLLLTIGRGATLPFMTIYLSRQYSLSVDLIGYAMTIALTIGVVFSLGFGILADKFDKKRYMLLAITAFASGFIAIPLVNNVTLVVLFFALINCAYSVFATVLKAWFADNLSSTSKTKIFSINYTMLNIGWTIGPPLGTLLVMQSINLPFWLAAIFMLTLAAAFSWACGNIFNKKIMSHSTRPAVMSLVIWSALIPIIPFFVASLILDGSASMIHSLVTIDMTTILSLMYLAFVATIVGYGIWGTLLGRYETWRVAPLSLLVPVVGLASAALLLDERLTGLQFLGAVLIMTGLYINVFGLRWRKAVKVRG